MLFPHIREDGTATFFYPHTSHTSVRVCGSFSGWQTPGEPLGRVERGWVGEVHDVPVGDLEYKLVVDGRWISDPLNLVQRPDGLGGHNSVLHRGEGRGSVVHLEFHSPALDETRPYVLYLPPGYAASQRRFPVLYLLHGALDWEKSWLERGDIAATLDGLRASGAIGDLIVVMPRENGAIYQGDGRAADYLARDLVGHVDHELRTLADRRHRALDGLSTGGFTSIVLGAARHDMWSSIGCMSASLDDRAFEAVRAHAASIRASAQRYRISWGLEEPGLDAARALARELDQQGVSVSLTEAPGIHDWPTWRGALPSHLRFHFENIAAS